MKKKLTQSIRKYLNQCRSQAVEKVYISPEGPSWPYSVEVEHHTNANSSSFSSPETIQVRDKNQNTHST